jgi:urease accessory protein
VKLRKLKIVLRKITAFYLALAVPSLIIENAYAHAVVFTGSSFAGGFFHSFSGLDHALAMLGVGFLSTKMERRDVLLLPACFLLFLAIGAGVGYSGYRFSFAETFVALSCLILGSFILLAELQRYHKAIFSSVATFGFVHGYVHLVELPTRANAFHFTVGFLSASLIMHITGVFIGEAFKDSEYRWLTLLCGTAMCFFGILFTFRSF